MAKSTASQRDAERRRAQRGALTDWTTQKWVQLTGRRVDLRRDPWLEGPVGDPAGIGRRFFHDLAAREGLRVRTGEDAGLLPRFADLAAPGFDPGGVDTAVSDFYERTAAFHLDAWGEWCGVFKPFGRILAVMFSRRLQQLNVPLSSLDTSRGVTSEIVQLVDESGTLRHTAWVRELVGTGDVLYAGSYSVCRVPRHPRPCVKVVFPLPNGNAMVVMRATSEADGSLLLSSSGSGFGDTGFYFTVHHPDGRVWARYLRTFRETIHVYPADGSVRADHVLTIWRATFLRLHYRLVRRGGGGAMPERGDAS